MKWLIVLGKYLPEHVGGNAIYVDRFIKELCKLGHEVTLLTSTNDKNSPEYEIVNNIEIIRVYLKSGALGTLKFQNRNLLTQKFKELTQKNRFDIVNIHTSCLLNMSCINAKRDYKLISTVHAVHTYELIFNLKKSLRLFQIKNIIKSPIKIILQYIFELNAIKNTDKVIVMSDYVKSTIKSFFGKKYLDKIFVSAIGISKITDLEKISKDQARNKLKLNNDDKIFITVRRLAPRMGLINLIKAFSLIDDDSAKLLIIGKGELYNRLKDYIAKLNLQNRVFLLGFVEDELLHYYYCAADCFILPTEELEGFGIVTIEALSYNLPVIGTPKGATPEILNKFDKNLITASHNADSIAKKINYFLKNHEEYNKNNFSDTANKEYNWVNIIKNLINNMV